MLHLPTFLQKVLIFFLSSCMCGIMVTKKRYDFEVHSMVSMAWILGLGPSLGLVRVPGIGLVYSELARRVPHIFSHFITNLPAIRSIVVFVCVKYLPVHTVPEGERFLV